MSMISDTMVLPAAVESAVDSLAESLLRSTPWATLGQAKERLQGDASAVGLLDALRQSQAMLGLKQARNEVTAADVEQWRRLQQQVYSNDAIAGYREAEQEAMAFLREMNRSLSELLGLDLASFLGSSCC